jgi:hypothetical protein
MNKIYWTEEEDRLLLTSNLTDTEIANKLKRTKDAIRNRRMRLSKILKSIESERNKETDVFEDLKEKNFLVAEESIKELTNKEIIDYVKVLKEVFTLTDSIELKINNYQISIKKIK